MNITIKLLAIISISFFTSCSGDAEFSKAADTSESERYGADADAILDAGTENLGQEGLTPVGEFGRAEAINTSPELAESGGASETESQTPEISDEDGNSTEEKAAVCPADESHGDPHTFTNVYRTLSKKIEDCLNQILPVMADKDALQRTSYAPWMHGRNSRDRNLSTSHGTFEEHSMKLICRILGFENFDSSTARDHNDNRGNDRLNWTGASDNSSFRFKDDVTFESLISDETIASTTYFTNVNRKNSGTNAEYQTWIQSITCSGKIQ